MHRYSYNHKIFYALYTVYPTLTSSTPTTWLLRIFPHSVGQSIHQPTLSLTPGSDNAGEVCKSRHISSLNQMSCRPCWQAFQYTAHYLYLFRRRFCLFWTMLHPYSAQHQWVTAEPINTAKHKLYQVTHGRAIFVPSLCIYSKWWVFWENLDLGRKQHSIERKRKPNHAGK